MPNTPSRAQANILNLFGIGTLEVLIIFAVAFLVLGPTRLVGVAKSLGTIIREMREATGQISRMIDEETEEEETLPKNDPKDGL